MIQSYTYNGETWIDVDNGTPEEIHKLMDEHDIHPFVAKELTSVTPRPRAEFHDHYIYCILHFPVDKHTHAGESKSQEVDFVIGKDTLITARYETIDALHKFSKDIEVQEILEKGDKPYKPSHRMFTRMLRELYNSLFEELEHIEDVAEAISAEIFKGKQRAMVVKISETTRTLLSFKRTTDMHHEVLEALRERGAAIFGDNWDREMEAVLLDYQKINATIRANLELLREFRETNNSLLSAKQNEVVKRFTVIGSVLFVISILVTIFLELR